MTAAPTPHPYHALSLRQLWQSGSPREKAALFGGWAGLTLLCMALGLAVVIWQWSGLPINVGGVTAYITIYPPHLICLFLTLTLGWWWGAIPAYLATFTLALYAGMPVPWAALFALADPLGFAILAMGYQAIAMRRDLRDLNSVLYFIQLNFVASVFASSGALIWSYTNSIDHTSILAIWQGWWLGAFLQGVFLIGPLMALGFPPVARWLDTRPQLLTPTHRQTRHSVLRLLGTATAGVLLFAFVTLHLAGNHLDLQTIDPASGIGQAIAVLHQTSWVLFWVFVLIILFIAFFGYQLFIHWQRSTDVLLDELHRANQRLETLAHTDSLTGLLNRRSIDEFLLAEWHRARRMNTCATLVMLDIDHFKQINDQYGHPVGDTVLRSLAEVIRSEVREMDVASRYGGEEFLVLLPGTDAEGAWQFAERLRQRVLSAQPSAAKPSLRFTVSIGLAVRSDSDRSPDDWLARADQALYQAKNSGRNRTIVAAEEPPM